MLSLYKYVIALRTLASVGNVVALCLPMNGRELFKKKSRYTNCLL